MGRGRNILKSWKSSLGSRKPSQQIVPVPVNDPVATTPSSTVPELTSHSINDPSNIITSQLHNDAVTLPPSESPIVLTGLIPLNSNTPIPDTYSEGTFPVDIIAVHGLNGGAYSTWTHPQNGMMWLRDLLPQELPGARVYSFGYASKVFSLDTSGFEDFARELLEGIRAQRGTASLQRRPLIFICHSMGGIVVKKALNITKVDDQRYAPILAATSAILFLATPHGGSATADFSSVLASIGNVALVGGLPRFRKDLIGSLKQNSKDLMDIARDFRNLTQGIKIYSFFEKAKIVGLRDLIVDQKSGSMNLLAEIVIPMGGCDHRSICRFENAQSVGYEKVSAALHEVAVEVTDKVHTAIFEDDQPCLQSLSFPDLHQPGTSHIRQSKSCGWLLQHPTYLNFLSSPFPCPLLLIKGHAGSGKSTLMAFLHSTCSKLPARSHGICLSFFFNGNGTQLHRSKLGMLRVLLWQIYQQSIDARNIIFTRWKNKQSVSGLGWLWGVDELTELFEEVLCRQRQEILVLVDAVDEAADETGVKTGSDVLECLRLLSTCTLKTKGKVRIVASCRYYPVYSAGASVMEIAVEESNSPDLARFVRAQLQNGVQAWNIFSEVDRRELEHAITLKAGGVFLWVVLRLPKVVKSLNDGSCEIRDLRELIEKESNELYATYQSILENDIDSGMKDRAFLFLQWVCLAERPLTLTELRLAMACNELAESGFKKCEEVKGFVQSDQRMERLVRSLSGGLARLVGTGKRNTIQLFHGTIYEFLRSQGLQLLAPGSAASSSVSQSEAEIIGASQERLSKSCLHYLCIQDVLSEASLDVETTLEKYCLLDYATRNWLVHAERAERCGISQVGVVEVLSSRPSMFDIWRMVYQTIDHHHPKCPEVHTFKIIHVGALYNLQSVVRHLLENGEFVDEVDEEGSTALHHSCRLGHEQVTVMLLEYEANIEAKNDSSNTPLELAAANGHEAIVSLLLSKGASTNEKTSWGGSALHSAAEKGNAAIIKTLVKAGANVHARGGHEGNALKAACYAQKIEVVKLLLSYKVNVNEEGGYHGTALHAAIAGRSEDRQQIIHLLLEAGANPNLDGCELGNALQAASLRGMIDLIKIFLEHGAEINSIGGEYGSALQAACARDHEELVNYLLNNGADVNAVGGLYGTALQAAASGGRIEIVQILLRHGADLRIQAGRYLTPLMAAAASPGPEVVKVLLDAGADPTAKGGYHHSVLTAAIYGGNYDVARYFLDGGFDINEEGGWYGSSLQAAIIQCSPDFIEFLLSIGANPNVMNGEYGSPLQAAIVLQRESIVKLLLANGADVNAFSLDGTFALQTAARGRSIGIVKLLLDFGADVNMYRDGWRSTAVNEAVAAKNKAIVELLLSRGAKLDKAAGFWYNAAEAAILDMNMTNFLKKSKMTEIEDTPPLASNSSGAKKGLPPSGASHQ